jgi:hypothetical protein
LKYLSSILIFFSLLPAVLGQQQNAPPQDGEGAGGGVILYSQGGAFMISGPKGWTTDRETGARIGTCCVFYPEGETWHDAETVLYPSIATKGPSQQTLNEFMSSDLDDFRSHNPAMTYEDGKEIPLKHGRSAKIRYFYNVNRGSSEAVAYIDEDKIVALVVMSSRTKTGLNKNMPLLETTLNSYAYMNVKFKDAAASDKK